MNYWYKKSLEFGDKLMNYAEISDFNYALIESNIYVFNPRHNTDCLYDKSIKKELFYSLPNDAVLDFKSDIQIDEYILEPNYLFKNWVWNFCINEHAYHDYYRKKISKIDFYLDQPGEIEKKINFLKDEIEKINIFDLDYIEVEYNSYEKCTNVELHSRLFIEQQFCLDFYLSILVDFVIDIHSYPAFQECGKDLAKYKLFLDLNSKCEQLNGQLKFQELEYNNFDDVNITTKKGSRNPIVFASLLYLEELGLMKKLTELYPIAADRSVIISEITASDPSNISSFLSRLGNPKKYTNREREAHETVRNTIKKPR